MWTLPSSCMNRRMGIDTSLPTSKLHCARGRGTEGAGDRRVRAERRDLWEREQVPGGVGQSGLTCLPWLLPARIVLTVHINTDVIFGLFPLLGDRFMPRPAELGSMRLVRVGVTPP